MAKWEKGHSGNPGGRPKEVAELKEMAREHTVEAITTLVSVMQDETAPHAARIRASECLLDRGYGKASQIVEASIHQGNNFFDSMALGLSQTQESN
jgi:hypothetical protein